MKRFLTSLTALLAVLILLVGCGSTQPAQSPQSSSAQQAGQAQPTQSSATTPATGDDAVSKKLDKLVSIALKVKNAVDKKDANTAQTQLKALDEAIDPLKDAIKAKDASLIPSLSAEAIEDAVKDSNFEKAGKLVASMQDALSKAKVIFTSKEAVSKGLDAATDLVTQAKAAVAKKDPDTANAKLGDLDKVIDPLKPSISAKNPDLKKDLSAEAIEDVLKGDKPDWSKADALLDAFQKAVDTAKPLFK